MTSIRLVALIAGVIFEFAAITTILLAMLPGKRASVDYLVIGTLATFISLATVFGVLMVTKKAASRKPGNVEID